MECIFLDIKKFRKLEKVRFLRVTSAVTPSLPLPLFSILYVCICSASNINFSKRSSSSVFSEGDLDEKRPPIDITEMPAMPAAYVSNRFLVLENFEHYLGTFYCSSLRPSFSKHPYENTRSNWMMVTTVFYRPISQNMYFISTGAFGTLMLFMVWHSDYQIFLMFIPNKNRYY